MADCDDVEWRVWPGSSGSSSFRVEGNGGIALRQYDSKSFNLASAIEYDGTTGLEGQVTPEGDLSQEALDMARRVDGDSLPSTDLASVPTPLRWFVGRLGHIRRRF